MNGPPDTYMDDDFDAYLVEQLKDPEYRAAYDDAGHREQVMDTLIGLRKAAGMSQRQVAQRMGVKQPTVSLFEGGGVDPKISTVQRYARAVGAVAEVTITEETQ